jgi:hypothetical protein
MEVSKKQKGAASNYPSHGTPFYGYIDMNN